MRLHSIPDCFLICMLAGLLLCQQGCLRSNQAESAGHDLSGAAKSAQAEPAKRRLEQIDPAILENRAFSEPPELKQRVLSGGLPPVSERLPEHPLVVAPLDGTGRYGGVLRRVLLGDIINETAITKTLNESLMGFERPLPRKIELNLAESYEFQKEGRVAIFKIRKGIKWSDGAPFTVDDILFWYEDMTLNEDARNVALFPSRWLIDGKPIRMERLDDLTLRFSASRPMGRLLTVLCYDDIAYPRHVLGKLHPKYNPEATYEDFKNRTTDATLAFEPGIPRLSGWYPAEWKRGLKAVYERNPYYWKVDTEGNQLPYLNKLEFAIVSEPNLILLKFINGELDLIGRSVTADMHPALKDAERKGRFSLHYSVPMPGPALIPNWDAERPALREAFRDRKVRLALSYAINREEVSALAYHGLLKPTGYSFGSGSPFYSEEDAMKYFEYDPGKARRLLREAGYPDDNGDGVRELKDGAPFEVTVDLISSNANTDACELVADYWRRIGLKVNLNPGLEDIIYPRKLNGAFEVLFMGQANDPLDRAYDYAIMGPKLPYWHRNAGREGPEWLREATDLINEALVTVEEKRLHEIMGRVRELHTENIPIITLGAAIRVWGAHDRLGNVPDEITMEDMHRAWSRPLFHEQLYIRN